MEAPSHPVVALVSSAGGLDATAQVLSGLPESLRATVIVLQHSPPDRHSRLAVLLQRMTGRPVTLAQDGDPLRTGAVLVAPSGCHTLVTHDLTTALIPSGPFPPWRPSADLLLTTMAMALGPRAVAVVLSGTSHDGATGASAVHQRGGVVLASDEATSAHFSMPLSTIERDRIRPPVLAVAEIAAQLPEILQALVAASRAEEPPEPAHGISVSDR